MISNDVCAVDVEIKDTHGVDAQISEKEKIEVELQQISEGGGAGNPYAVLYVEQSLTETQMAQARENIDAQPTGDYAIDSEIRLELEAINRKLTAFFDSDDQTLDELSEIVAYITSNKSLIDAITTSKVSVSDIVNNLTTNYANRTLSAAQGVVLKGLIDALSKNKLDSSSLTTAVNEALAQAKASGEFDGKDGYTPVKGVDYFDGAPGDKGEKGDKGDKGDTGAGGAPGKDGISATHSWNGTVLTVTSASGTSSADLKGAKGDKGDSIKGDPGSDGVSPTVAVSKSGKVTTVSITDKNGTKTATINDGADGAKGDKGDKGDTGATGAAGKDGVVDVTVARVGQTVRVTAVDGNSRPTAWEAVDYQPRTHYALPRKVLADNVKLTTGLVNWISYNIIKDYPTVTVVVAGNTFVCPVTRVDEFTQNGDESYFYIGNYNGAAPEYPFYLFGYIGNDFATVYPNSGYTVSVIANEYVCKLDEKYLPSTAGGSVASDWNAAEGEAGHIKNRTHWEEKRKTLFFEGDTDSYGNIDNPNVADIFMIPGETYELEWDGVVYRDKARYLYEVLGIEPGSVHTLPDGSDYTVQKYNIVWGDLSYYLGGDPTMPLSIESTDEDMWVYHMGGVDGVRHIAIYNVYEIIQKLDPKFLPDMSMPFKYKRYILEYAASDLTPSSQTGFTASAAKQTEVGNLLAELSALTTIHMNMSVAVPAMGEIMRLPVLFRTKNEALGANGNISAVSYDGVVFLADEEVTTAALGSINIYKSGLMVSPADNYQAIAMFGVKITLDVLYL